MSKIDLKIFQKSSEGEQNYTTTGIYNEVERTITFKENDKLKTTATVYLKTGHVKRENKDIEMILTFNKKQDTISNCKLKEMGYQMSLILRTKVLTKGRKKFHVEYETRMLDEKIDDFIFELTYNLP